MVPRFDPANPVDRTPPFIRWTLAHPCPFRECGEYFDPDRTDRLLRAVRTFSNALAEERVHNDIVLARDSAPLGFRISTALEPFGGTEQVQQTCGNCHANALLRNEPSALAGCVGYVIPPECDDFHTRFNQLTEELIDSPFPTTAPRWLGLWINPRPGLAELVAQRELLQRIASERNDVVELDDYLLAINTALEHDLPLVVCGYPGGNCQGRRWVVEPHCDRCRSSWPEARRQQCRACGQVGGRQPEQIRKRMGTRPYRPWSEFLSAAEIAELSLESPHPPL